MISANRLDREANETAEFLTRPSPSGEGRQQAADLLAAIREYRTRAARHKQSDRATNAEICFQIENALAAATKPEPTNCDEDQA